MIGLGWAALFSFLLGAIPTAYLVTKKVTGLDIRKQGSGNVGATNAVRVLGKKYGALVFLADLLKGAIPVWIILTYLSGPDAPLKALWIGIFAVLGHIFTPFLGFKGGKGVATSLGVVCAVYPVLFFCTLGVGLLVFSFTRIVSLSSLFALFTLILTSWFYSNNLRISLLFCGLFFLVAWTHRANVSRLLRGEEAVFSKKNKT